MAERPAAQGRCVAVTGASGFIGSTIVALLLERGYTVRGCVRDPKSEKAAFLLRLPGAGERLTLHAADLTHDESFHEAFAGVAAVIHTAAAVILTAKDPQREIVDVTVNGVKNVLRSCERAARAGTLKRFVSTSSIASIMDSTKPKGHVYTEDDHNMAATLASDPYSFSKRLEDEAIDAFVAALPAEARFSHVFINPGAVYGPVLAAHHLQGSSAIVHDLMTGKYPMIPDLGFPAVDVRDVALAHVLAMENASMAGKHLCVEQSYHFRQLAEAGRAAFPQYKWPTWRLPNTLMYVAAVFDSRISWAFLRINLGVVRQVTSAKLQTATGMRFRPILTDTVPVACQSLLDLAIVPRRS